MTQLNVHIPATSTLLERIHDAAAELGTSESSLARMVLEIALDPYVQAQLEVRRIVAERTAPQVSGKLIESRRRLRSGPVPPLPFEDAEATDEVHQQTAPRRAPALASR